MERYVLSLKTEGVFRQQISYLSFINALGYNPGQYIQVTILYTLVYMYICMSVDVLTDNQNR